MVHPEADPSVTVRSVFVIDPNKKVRLILTYPPSAGRNFDEVLRVIDSLQLTDRQKVATPANWRPGDKAIIVPSVSDEAAKDLFPQGWETVKPYLRVVSV
jgi:alkyl hydroperoxide reductase subunit AhpC